MILRSLAAVAAVLLLAGCSTGDSDDGVTAAPSPTPTAKTLKTICPEVEGALPRDIMVPDERQLEQIQSDIAAVGDGADLEAANALQLLLDGIDHAAAAYDDSSAVMPALDASEAFDNGISAFAERCRAAGSSALQ